MGRGPWRGIALFLLFGIVIAAVAGVAYNVGVDHGTTVEVVGDGEVVRQWGPWRHGGFFFPIVPILFFLLFGFLFLNVLRSVFAPRHWGLGPGGWGGPPWAYGGRAWSPDEVREMRATRFDEWHRRAHERADASTPAGDQPTAPGNGATG